jgi:pimeloyl-ACP methyl ester carboxylesterase
VFRSVRPAVGWVALAGVLVLAGLSPYTWWETARIERDFPPQGRFVAVRGGRIHVTQRVPAGAPRATVVLLHGASGNQADIMTPLGDRLAAKRFRVLAPDRPGHGWSDRIDGAAAGSPAAQAGILRQAFDELGVQRAIVVGHSWSGAVAVNLALDQPDFTQGLVLIAPAVNPWPGEVAWYNGIAGSRVIGDLFTNMISLPLGMALIDSAVREVFAPNPVPPGYVRTSGMYMILRPNEFMANAQDLEHFKRFLAAQAPRMSAIRVPTAIVTGDTDAIVSPDIQARAAQRAIPGASLTVLPGVGHMPHYADPDRVVALIEDVATRSGRSSRD